VLTKCRVYTTLPDADLELARASYEGVLGFAPASITPGGVFETYDFPGFRCRDLHRPDRSGCVGLVPRQREQPLRARPA